MAKKQRKISITPKISWSLKVVLHTLQLFSKSLLVSFCAKLFSSPLRHPLQKRELEMNQQSAQQFIKISSLKKEVCVYRFGTSNKKILLVHGWSGRGTQLVKIAEALIKEGFCTISFDAPAHGKSPGKTTLMPEFIAAILEIDKQFGPFEGAVGHSLGGMSLLNAVKKGLGLNYLVTIGSGDIIDDIIADFLQKVQVNQNLKTPLKEHFERQTNETMDSFSAYIAAQSVTIPVLVIHDNNDVDVPVSAAINIHRNLRNGKLFLTNGLGHRKILGDSIVIKTILNFIKKTQNENEIIDVNRSFVTNSMSRANE